MTGRSLDSDQIAGSKFDMSCITVISFSGIFETHLDQIGIVVRFGNIGQPVVDFQFRTFPTTSARVELCFFRRIYRIVIVCIIHFEFVVNKNKAIDRTRISFG